MCDEALTPARFSCICHMREPFNEPFIVGNPWFIALHLPPVGHNTEYFGEQNILLKLIKMHDLFLIYQGQMRVTVL